MTNAAYYLTFTFAVERRKTLTGEGGSAFLLANTLSLFVVLFAKPLGGWLSGLIFDLTGSYQAAFLNGIAWNLLNIAIMATVLWRTRGPRPLAA